MKAKELRVNLRDYAWWTTKEFADALEISEEDAAVRIEELLGFKVIEEVWGHRVDSFRFVEQEERSRFGGSTVYLQIPHDCTIRLVKHGVISTLLAEWERWRVNRLMSKEQRIRTKAAEKYQKQWAQNVGIMRNRFLSRY